MPLLTAPGCLLRQITVLQAEEQARLASHAAAEAGDKIMMAMCVLPCCCCRSAPTQAAHQACTHGLTSAELRNSHGSMTMNGDLHGQHAEEAIQQASKLLASAWSVCYTTKCAPRMLRCLL